MTTVVLFAGCGDRESHSSAKVASHLHVDTPPHGGVPVALGDDYQIEWVLDPVAGKLQAFVLDGEMENFVRIAPPSFPLTIKLPAGDRILHLAAIANSATGEKVGGTSLFEVQDDWLKTNKSFDAVLPTIEVQGTFFTNVAFHFSKGSEGAPK